MKPKPATISPGQTVRLRSDLLTRTKAKQIIIPKGTTGVIIKDNKHVGFEVDFNVANVAPDQPPVRVATTPNYLELCP